MVPVKNHHRPIMHALKIAGCLVLVLGVAGLLMAAKPGLPQTKKDKDTETCGACHEDVAKGFAKKAHSAIGDASCTSCHTGSEQHLKDGGGPNIFAFRSTDDAAAKNKACLKCHASAAGAFMAGPHGKASLDCTSCHTMHHSGQGEHMLRAETNKTCATCHQDVMAKFAATEKHRLQEGGLTCASCHNPHSSGPREQLGGFKQEACLKCHTDKGGPFLYEHGASRVEGCSVCHDVHGTPNRHMLTTQSVGDLCFGCHVFSPQWHGKMGEKTTNCVNCHTTIHGSNASRIFIK
jgi:DmsE family decaheme c-type cytochrome